MSGAIVALEIESVKLHEDCKGSKHRNWRTYVRRSCAV